MPLPDESSTAAPDLVAIATRTERRALDWSLVLASQEIHAVIQTDTESGWVLLVPRAERERAIAAIAQYRRENLHWPWQRPVLQSGLLFDWSSTLWVLLTGVFHWLGPATSGLREQGVMDRAAVAQGEWWRLFTAELLHADFIHLATNGIFGFILLGLAMGRFGTGIAMLGACLAGAAGNSLSWLVHPEAHRSLGASGVVMGALGLLAAQSLNLLRAHPRGWKIALAGLAAGGMLFTLLGLNPASDVAAHLGGFVAGVFLGALLAPFAGLAQRPMPNLLAGLIFTVLIIWTWILALRPLR